MRAERYCELIHEIALGARYGVNSRGIRYLVRAEHQQAAFATEFEVMPRRFGAILKKLIMQQDDLSIHGFHFAADLLLLPGDESRNHHPAVGGSIEA